MAAQSPVQRLSGALAEAAALRGLARFHGGAPLQEIRLAERFVDDVNRAERK
jgi:hypothetical protein